MDYEMEHVKNFYLEQQAETKSDSRRLAAVRELLREALRHGLKEKTMHLIVESLRIIDSP